MYWVMHHSPVLAGDECEYTRLAENLLRRHEYVGLLEGPELIYPPLFPLLIAAASFLTGSVVTAGRVVSVSGGVLLVVALFFLVREMYGRRIALVASTIAAVHPLLLFASGTTYSESIYLPLMVGGIYWGVRTAAAQRKADAALCGTCFGLAYLTRPEAFVYPFVACATLLVAAALNRASRRALYPTAAAVVIPAIVLAAPYIAYLSIETGRFRIESKSVANFAIGKRMADGLDFAHANLGIGNDLKEEGPNLSPNLFAASAQFGVPPRALVSYWLKTAWTNRRTLPQWLVVYPAFGSFLMVGLVALGLLGRPWNRERLVVESLPLMLAAGYVLLLLGMPFLQLRFLLPLLPFLITWSAKGIGELAEWTRDSARQMRLSNESILNRFGVATTWTLMACLPLLAIHGVDEKPQPDPKGLALREAGLWLHDHMQNGRRIMAAGLEVAYYADGDLVALPEADAPLALEYVRSKSPDVLVLTHDGDRARYQEKWRSGGLEDASLLRTFGEGADEVAVYEWHRLRSAGEPE